MTLQEHNEAEVERTAISAYKAHPRHRAYCLGVDSARHITSLYVGTGSRTELFYRLLEALTDRHGLNLLRPAQRERRAVPQQWRDDSGGVLPNPWVTGNKKDQAALMRNHPDLAKHLQRLAEEPYAYLVEQQQAELERLGFNERENAYNADAHAKNPFVRVSLSQQMEWAKNVSKELVEQYRREANTVDLTEAVGKKRSLTLRSKIFKVDQELFGVLESAEVREKRLDEAAAAAAEAQHRQDVLLAHTLKMAEKDAKVGVARLRDGRIITNATAI